MKQKLHPTALHSLRVELSLTGLPSLGEVLHHALVQDLPHLIWQMALLEPVDDELRQVSGAQRPRRGSSCEQAATKLPSGVPRDGASQLHALLVHRVPHDGPRAGVGRSVEVAAVVDTAGHPRHEGGLWDVHGAREVEALRLLRHLALADDRELAQLLGQHGAVSVDVGQMPDGVADGLFQPEAVRGGGLLLHGLARAPAKALAPLDEEPTLVAQHRWELPEPL